MKQKPLAGFTFGICVISMILNPFWGILCLETLKQHPKWRWSHFIILSLQLSLTKLTSLSVVRFSKFKIQNRSTQKVINNQTPLKMFLLCTIVNCYEHKWTCPINIQDFIKCTLLLLCALDFHKKDATQREELFKRYS